MRRIILLVCAIAAVAALLATVTACSSCSPAPRTGGGTGTPPQPPPEPVVWPLLGTPAPNAGAIRVRVVSVKVENSPQARPQTGLSSADVVYETITEGGITRYDAMYHSTEPARVGPVRSARLSDAYLVPQYHALLARIGGNFVTDERLREANVEDMNAFRNPAPYTRSSARRAPHNLYVSVPALRKAAVAKGFPATADPPEFVFGDPPSSGAATATAIDVPFSPSNRVTWTWSAQSRRYVRSLNGSRRGDAGSDRPYEAANVVVLFVQTTVGRALDPAGNPTFDVQLAGTGQAAVFRGGKRYDATWTAGTANPPVLRGAGGQRIAFEPGRTWFQVLPTGAKISSR